MQHSSLSQFDIGLLDFSLAGLPVLIDRFGPLGSFSSFELASELTKQITEHLACLDDPSCPLRGVRAVRRECEFHNDCLILVDVG